MSNVDFMKSAYAAFAQGDVPTVLGAMDLAIEWNEAEGTSYRSSDGAWIGAQEVLDNVLMKLGTEWDGFTVTPHAFYDGGDVVVVEVRYTGSFKESGKDLDAQVCHIWKVRDGKIVSFQQYMDTAQWQDVTGTRS